LLVVTLETGDHCREHCVGIETIKLERVSGIVGQQCEECQLRPSVAFAESVYGIQFGEEMRRPIRKRLSIKIPELVGLPQRVE
jgi:hypothetical protein